MRIGVIFTSYNHAEYLHGSIAPWIAARADKLNGHEYLIAAVSVPFKEYQHANILPDNTTELLREYYNNFQLDYFIDSPQFILEAEARNNALQLLLSQNIDVIILVDGDEFFTEQEISQIFDFVALNKWVSWFSLSLKNYVFDKFTYLEQPFTPPRIFRVDTNGFQLGHVYHDNDMAYSGQVVEEASLIIKPLLYKQLPTKVIPKSIAWVRHMTWLNNDKSKSKIEYQLKHFGGMCSYSWGANGLEFNKEYFRRNGQNIPTIRRENS